MTEAGTPEQPMTVRDLAEQLTVPMQGVIKALMTTGAMRTATEVLPADEIQLVTRLIESEPERFSGGQPPPAPWPPDRRRPPRRPPGGAPVREPRSPRPRDSASGAVADEDESE